MTLLFPPRRVLPALAALVLLAPAASHAQRSAVFAPAGREEHEYLWVSGGFAAMGVEGCGELCRVHGRQIGGGLSLAGGWAFSQHFLVGVRGEAMHHGGDEGTSKWGLRLLTVVAHWYPSDTAGFFVRVGGGAARGLQSLDARGTVAQVGVGYDFGLSPTRAITVDAGYSRTFGMGQLEPVPFGGQPPGTTRRRTDPDVVTLRLGLTLF